MLFWRKKDPRGAGTPQAASSGKVALGELMLKRGLVTTEQLEEALRRQRANHRFIGEILVEMGAITRLDVTRMLELQHKLSQGAERG